MIKADKVKGTLSRTSDFKITKSLVGVGKPGKIRNPTRDERPNNKIQLTPRCQKNANDQIAIFASSLTLLRGVK